ncbi:MAG: undecaprenyl-diphosphate phosphatase [Candidatus Diapherotrites archaeon]|nr:undecaprenyl-diphosphate phosphatase [Candidatus Diapherotrites archaeon]
MTDLLTAVVLGIIQGVTEWLPISSQGNVMAAAQFMGASASEAFSYAVVLHIGTLIAAIVYFWKEIIQLAKLQDKQLLKFLAIAVVFTGLTALPSYLFIKTLLEQETIQILGLTIFPQTIFLFLIGILLLATGALQQKKKFAAKTSLSNKNAVALGLGQGFTVLPGLSRSGTTASILLFEKFSPEQAFRISFLLSIPSVLIGELAFKAAEAPIIDANMMIGIMIAAVIGFASIHALLKIAKRINFALFCYALAIFYIIIGFVSLAAPFIA